MYFRCATSFCKLKWLFTTNEQELINSQEIRQNSIRPGYVLFPMILWLIITMFPTWTSGQPISAEQNYAVNSPGVVAVQTVFSATVYVNKVRMNERRFQALVDSVNLLDTTGTMFSAEEKLDMVVKALYLNPFRFLVSTNDYYRQQHRINSAGTGFFVTADGYLITNSHIIDRDSAFIRRKFILSTFQEVTEANIRALESSWAMTLTDDQRSMLNNAYSLIYSQVSDMILFDLRKEIFVQFRTDGGQGASGVRRLPARTILSGKPMPGKDVAILKVDSVSQLPALTLSADPIARIGEQVLVYGYPEPVTSNTYLAKETNIEPTLTAGIVSAIKRSIGGWRVVQMDAVITHGSSGSPVCDDRGHVIGLATFGSLEQKTGSLATGFNFAIPLEVIREFLDSANVTPAISLATSTYNAGLDLFYQGYYAKALKKFHAVKKINASYPYLTSYIQQSEALLKKGADRESTSNKIVFRIMAGLLFFGGLYLAWRWKRK